MFGHMTFVGRDDNAGPGSRGAIAGPLGSCRCPVRIGSGPESVRCISATRIPTTTRISTTVGGPNARVVLPDRRTLHLRSRFSFVPTRKSLDFGSLFRILADWSLRNLRTVVPICTNRRG